MFDFFLEFCLRFNQLYSKFLIREFFTWSLELEISIKKIPICQCCSLGIFDPVFSKFL